MTLAGLIAHYGWAAVFIGALLEGETVVLMAAVLVQHGMLDFRSVLLSAAMGAFAGDQFFFHLGRHHGSRLFTNHPAWQHRLDRAVALLERRRKWVILFYRFIYGMRAVIPFLLGSGIGGVWWFTALSAFSAAIWAVVMGVGGYWFGDLFQHFLRQSRHIQQGILCGGILLLMVIAGFRWWRRRSSDKDAGKTKS
jgi:membrane protein DedA with SNARE-associated domain